MHHLGMPAKPGQLVNIARHAMRLTGVARLTAILGGFHRSGAAFEPVIEPTVAEFTELASDLIVPGHCTGWNAQHRLARRAAARLYPQRGRHVLHGDRRRNGGVLQRSPQPATWPRCPGVR